LSETPSTSETPSASDTSTRTPADPSTLEHIFLPRLSRLP
jgi:hypothetical protein